MLNTEAIKKLGTMKRLETTGTAPSPRNSLSMAACGKNIYVFGGIREDFNTKTDSFYNDLYQLDLQTNTWTKLSPLDTQPSPRGTAGAIGLDNELLIFGGTYYEKGYANLTMFNEVWSYSITENKWTLRQPSNPPPARAKPMVWQINDKMYVFGGITAKYQTLNDFWCYDPKSNNWQELKPNNASPSGRLEARGGHKGNNLILYSGEGFDPAQKGLKMLDDIWLYDINTNAWTNLTPQKENIPIHNYACSGVIDDYLYIIAGDIKGMPSAVTGFGAPFPQNLCNDIWRFHLTKRDWEQIEAKGDKTPAVKQAGAIVLNNKIYIVGGYNFINKDGKGPGQIWNEDTFVYAPDL